MSRALLLLGVASLIGSIFLTIRAYRGFIPENHHQFRIRAIRLYLLHLSKSRGSENGMFEFYLSRQPEFRRYASWAARTFIFGLVLITAFVIQLIIV